MPVFIDLPLDYRITKYLESRYGRRSVLLTQDDMLLKHIRSLFVKPKVGDKPVKKGNCYFTFILPAKMEQAGLLHISPENVAELNSWLKEHLYECIFNYALTVEMSGKTLKDGFIEYRRRIGLSEEDWPYETIKKAYQRSKGQSKVRVLAD
jgi:hypothetical protein